MNGRKGRRADGDTEKKAPSHVPPSRSLKFTTQRLNIEFAACGYARASPRPRTAIKHALSRSK